MKHHIMLVDDDRDDQMIFTAALSEISAHFHCSCFDTAVSGLQNLNANSTKPACIFLDLNLPLMHGFEFLALLKKSPDFKDIPVIIYTTSSREADKKKANELGAQNFLSKPTSFQDLIDKMSLLLKSVSLLN